MKPWVLSHPLSAPRRCPGWSESSMGTQIILLVLSCAGSKWIWTSFFLKDILKERELCRAYISAVANSQFCLQKSVTKHISMYICLFVFCIIQTLYWIPDVLIISDWITCMSLSILSRSDNMSASPNVPRMVRSVVAPNNNVDWRAFSMFIVAMVASYILAYITASTTTVTESFVNI